ncbi:MAG: acyl carrier protein [Cyanobacteria bacterium J06621_11]
MAVQTKQNATTTGNSQIIDTSSKSDSIRQWIVIYLSDLLEISANEIDTEIPFDSYGLDSSAAIGLTGDLEDWLGQEVDPTLLYDYPTVESLVDYLATN